MCEETDVTKDERQYKERNKEIKYSKKETRNR
jgi:hypothetical protein